jgi:hypothetical protein
MERTYRLGKTSNDVVVGIYVIFWMLLVVGAPDPTASAVTAVLGALCGIPLIRLARVALIADSDGLLVRNVWRTHRLAWQDVDRFEVAVGRAGAHRFPNTCRLRVRDGRTLNVDGASASNVSGHDGHARVQAAVDELNAQLRQLS